MLERLAAKIIRSKRNAAIEFGPPRRGPGLCRKGPGCGRNLPSSASARWHPAGRVSDSLIACQKNRESRAHQEKLLEAARDAASLARLRYQGGAASYLEVLTNETNAYSAEIGLSGAVLAERLALVQLYNALGGGWTP